MAKKEVDYKDLRSMVDLAENNAKHGQLRMNFAGKEKNEKTYTYALALLDQNLNKDGQEGYATQNFNSIREALDKEDGLSKGTVEKYQKALAKRGYRLLDKARKKNIYVLRNNKNILEYCDEHLGDKPSGLEKAITVISLLSVVLGIAIGYPALTGNVVAENVKSSTFTGLALFVLGLLGVFIANKK
ncbi:MAG: hypothetical protein NTZ83_05690 [Candidatus Pacearchaeota archaeon]|nr:hypothetical protein [Candidatus Pacearchaeota archaeon]